MEPFNVPETNSRKILKPQEKAIFEVLPEERPSEPAAGTLLFAVDPVYLGQYPEDILKEFGQFFPKVTDADMKLISQPLDFFGQNISMP